ncbi:MAG: hypothetical protein GY799_07515, partial [Desulfobulbaceae bacterium]|nr:hypothetical protein [Desulfobulbaceae bacterium]
MTATLLQETIDDNGFRDKVRSTSSSKGIRFHGNQEVVLQFPNGTKLPITSPWFAREAGAGRRKKGPKKMRNARKGSHLILDLMGFFNKTCPTLAFRALKLGTLCPSWKIASDVLADEGIVLSAKKIGSMVNVFSSLSATDRCRLSRAEGESLAGKRVVICVDGGRLRERRNRKGRVPLDMKRRGFDAPWREPRLFTIYTVNERGEMLAEQPINVDGTVPISDADTLDCENFVAELAAYLKVLEINKATDVTLFADGAAWIWSYVPPMLNSLGVSPECVTEIMDMTHARQNLN